MSALSGPTIEAVGLHKRYEPRVRTAAASALRGVSLTAGPGVTAVLGANGAGKTTLLSIVAGFLRPSRGTVTVAGRSPRRWLRRHGAGVVPERFAAPGGWRVGAALRDLARLSGRTRREAGAAAGAALGAFALEALAARRLDELSLGELQRFGLAQASLGEPSFLVLDEPDQGLDDAGRRALVTWLRARREAGATILVATHDAALAGDLADRVVVLARGTVHATFRASPSDRIATRYRVSLETPHPALSAWVGPADGPPSDEAVVRVADATELQVGLRRLQEAGARIVGLVPEGTAIEGRLRRALDEAGAAALDEREGTIGRDAVRREATPEPQEATAVTREGHP